MYQHILRDLMNIIEKHIPTKLHILVVMDIDLRDLLIDQYRCMNVRFTQTSIDHYNAITEISASLNLIEVKITIKYNLTLLHVAGEVFNSKYVFKTITKICRKYLMILSLSLRYLLGDLTKW